MGRLNIERQNELQPKRIQYAKDQIEKLGYVVNVISNSEVQFEFKGSVVKFWPYSGWFTGKTVKDDRGIQKLLNQISPNTNN